jgi:hypothetical protein
MKWPVLVCAAVALLGCVAVAAERADAAAREVLALERKAMDGWQAGNPDPALAVSDPGITYFHVVADKRLDGLPALKAVFENYRGRSLFDSYEMADPKVQTTDDSAVLTYIIVRHAGASTTS